MNILYLANTTKQNNEFHYRVPGSARLHSVMIPAGEQTKLPHENLSGSDLAHVIDSSAHYGLVDEKTIMNMRAYVGLCYSINKPIDMRRVRFAVEKNDEFLTQQADQMHRENLAAADQTVKKLTGGDGKMATLEVTEQVPANEERKGTRRAAKIAGAGEG